MGNGSEGRTRMCWTCQYFVQTDETYANGVCVRHAPDLFDFTEGGAVTGKPTNFEMFPNVFEPGTGLCGDYKPATVAPPETIPSTYVRPPS